MAEYILATRPWSFTAALVPVLVATAVTGKEHFQSKAFVRCVIMAISVQAGANLTNTVFDYWNGIDTKKGGERTLTEDKLPASHLIVMSALFYGLGVYSLWPFIAARKSEEIIYVLAIGLGLAFFYTANPVGLKYRALGDITIYLCFGPLIMQCVSLALTGALNPLLNTYAVPVGLMTEAILHANNARDINADKAAGATTLATILGYQNAYMMYVLLLVAAYASCLVLAVLYNWGCALTLLTAPLAHGLVEQYKSGKMKDLPEETAKTHLPFGLVLLAGILASDGQNMADLLTKIR